MSAIGRAREAVQRPILLAHRGAHDEATRENSLAALAAGAEQCDGVEFDVRHSADGIAVIVHDETLDRLFGISRSVHDLSATELAEIGVPSLTEVLAAMPDTTLMDLELKEEPTDALFAALVAARGPEVEGVVVSSFYPGILRTVEERAPSLARWLNAESVEHAEQATELGCEGVSVSMQLLSDANITRWREAGLEIAAWTIRDALGAAWARDLRLTALCVEGEGATAARAAKR